MEIALLDAMTGSHLVAKLLDSGYVVTVLDNLSSGAAENLNLDHSRLAFIQVGMSAAPLAVGRGGYGIRRP